MGILGGILVGILVGSAVALWVAMFVIGIRLSQHRSGRMSLGSMLMRGTSWFDASNFKAEMAGLHRLFVWGFVGFFICILAAIVIAVLLGTAR